MTRRTIRQVELDKFEVDEAGRLYWTGQQVVLEQKISLKRTEMVLAVIVAASTAAMAIWPILVHFNRV